MIPCASGRHVWIDPVGAARCCNPGWRREFRASGDQPSAGDDPLGATRIRSLPGCGWVWVRVDDGKSLRNGKIEG